MWVKNSGVGMSKEKVTLRSLSGDLVKKIYTVLWSWPIDAGAAVGYQLAMVGAVKYESIFDAAERWKAGIAAANPEDPYEAKHSPTHVGYLGQSRQEAHLWTQYNDIQRSVESKNTRLWILNPSTVVVPGEDGQADKNAEYFLGAISGFADQYAETYKVTTEARYNHMWKLFVSDENNKAVSGTSTGQKYTPKTPPKRNGYWEAKYKHFK